MRELPDGSRGPVRANPVWVRLPHWVFDRPSTTNELLVLDDEERPVILAGNAEVVFDL